MNTWIFTPKNLLVQQLKPADYAQRLNFAGQMKVIFMEDDNPRLLLSDEANFYLNGMVNQQKCRY